MRKKLLFFLRINKKVLIGMLLGLVAGYLYWLNYGIYWGSYFLSAECWVNCIYGCLVGGFLSVIFTGSKDKVSVLDKDKRV